MRDAQPEPHNIQGDTRFPTVTPESQFDIEPPPDGGYGWVQVGVAFTINTFTWGQTAVRFFSPL
jgi:hypothetical protein